MREIWFENAGTRLFAVDDGDGEALAMLHGGMASHVAARPLVAPLSEQYRVVTPDLRASGRSWCGSALSFDQLADDVLALMDHLGLERAVVGGVSSGSGVALRFALRWPARTAGLIVVQPMYAGAERGYSEAQRTIFAGMDAVASRALEEGVQVLRPLYANLPSPRRERALEMLETFDAASVVATSRFLASGAQPFATAADLGALRVPALLVAGDDPMHPAEISELYAAAIPDCRVVPAATADVPPVLGEFMERILPA